MDYCQVVEPAAFNSDRLIAPMLLLNNDIAWTGFHVDSKPSLQTVSSLLVGRKWWFIVKAGDSQRSLCRQELTPLRLAVALRQNLYPEMQKCVQEPGDTIYLPNNCAHAVLSNDGWTILLTWQLQPLSEKQKKLQERACINGGKGTHHKWGIGPPKKSRRKCLTRRKTHSRREAADS